MVKHTIQINENLYSEIKEYCQLNNIKIGAFIEELIESAFMKEKWGESPFDYIIPEKENFVTDNQVHQLNEFEKQVENINHEEHEEVNTNDTLSTETMESNDTKSITEIDETDKDETNANVQESIKKQVRKRKLK